MKSGLMECRVAVIAVKAQIWPVRCVTCTAVFNAAFQPRRYIGDEIIVSLSSGKQDNSWCI